MYASGTDVDEECDGDGLEADSGNRVGRAGLKLKQTAQHFARSVMVAFLEDNS